MQPIRTVTIAVLCENSITGNKFVEALTNHFGEGKYLSDQRRFLYQQFTKVINNVQVCVNALKNSEDWRVSSLHPIVNPEPDLIFVFNSCVGVKKELTKGDFVILDQSHETLKNYVKDNETQILECLPEVRLDGVDLDESLIKIISFLHQGPKMGKEIRDMLQLPGENFRFVMEKVLIPNKEIFWSFNPTTYQWELSLLGEKKFQELSLKTINHLRKPCIYTGTSDCTPSTIKSKTDQKVDIIDQLSKVVFESHRFTVEKVKTLHVSVVNCYEGGDPEEPSPYAQSMGEAMAAFLVKMVEIHLRNG